MTAEHNVWCPQNKINDTAEHMNDYRTQCIVTAGHDAYACRTQYKMTAEHNA
jgi:hypothetical protein